MFLTLLVIVGNMELIMGVEMGKGMAGCCGLRWGMV